MNIQKLGNPIKETDKNDILLKVDRVTKYYPGIRALNNVTFSVKKSEIHGVIGENGAGKTTLCNVITGICKPDKGKIYWKNEEVIFSQPKDALNLGIRMVYQERNLIPFLTGAQNICLGNEERKYKGIINDEQAIYKKACEIREKLGTNVVLNKKVQYLSSSARQMIEIMRSFIKKPELLILDEPTSSLTEGDIKLLFDVIKNMKEQGVSIIFISHKLNEIFNLTDSITIFRNGENVHYSKTSDLNRTECIKYMLNRDLKHAYPEVINHSVQEKILEVNNLQALPEIKDISFYIKKGELLGFYGLVGSGRTETAEIIYGLREKDKGEILYNKEPLNGNTAEESIKKGLLLLPEDRKEHAIFNLFNIKQNISIPVIKSKLAGILGMIKFKEEKEYAENISDSSFLRLKYRNINQSLNELSGGNKQKVIIGRWLGIENNLLFIMDEPTQGIDIGTKYEIYVLARELTKNGVSVIFICSELPELLGICDRMYVFRFGYVVGELKREEFSEEEVLRYALA
jgi:ABC-type sugar transport system ATPase subunit